MTHIDTKRLDRAFTTTPAPRGTGKDRRPLIVIDGKNYTREHAGRASPKATPPSSQGVARRIAAKRLAFELALTLGELIGVCMIMGSIVLLAVAVGG